jgi:hypothetical protein
MTKAEIDYRTGVIPAWVREVIETQLAIEAEDARRAGQIGFMSRALITATMPYKDPKTDVYARENGKFRLKIIAGYEGGIPFGIYPRLLVSWITTEAVRNQSPEIQLGDSLKDFLKNVLDLKSNSGGARGTSTRVLEQMKRLFGSLISAYYTDDNNRFALRNMLIAEELRLSESNFWEPQTMEEAGQWQSIVRLTDSFYKELVTSPVPIDLRAYKALRGSPLAMDIYTWLTYRMSYTVRPTNTIRWESLMMQFGSGYGSGSDLQPDQIDQAKRNFRKSFLKALKSVEIIYPTANFKIHDDGIILLPSPTHIEKGIQGNLF